MLRVRDGEIEKILTKSAFAGAAVHVACAACRSGPLQTAPRQAKKRRLECPCRCALRSPPLLRSVSLAAAACRRSTISITGSVEPTGPVPPAAGKVYIFRGMGGRVASFEMDNLTEKLKRSGINSETYNHVNWRGPADEAIARYKSETRKSPIIVAGHSAGGDASIRFAERLKEANVPVSLIVSFDPTRFGGRVPPNVDRFINVWSSTNSSAAATSFLTARSRATMQASICAAIGTCCMSIWSGSTDCRTA